jgi:hypothetical protein
VKFHFNTLYNWPGFRLQATRTSVRSITGVSIIDNLMQCPNQEHLLGRLDGGYVREYSFGRNVYHSARDRNAWFRVRDVHVSAVRWIDGVDESGGKAGEVQFQEPSDDLGAFLEPHVDGAGSARRYIQGHITREPGGWNGDVAPAAAVEWLRTRFAPKDAPAGMRAGAVPGRPE